MLTVDPYPLLDLRAFVTRLPRPLGELPSPAAVTGLLTLAAPQAACGLAPNIFAAPLHPDDNVRQAVRDLLRTSGFKPTGRSKPASEYLVKAADEGRLASINLAVDVCNAVSLHSGLPISVVDLDLAQPPLRVAVAPAGAAYVFNAAGQTIALAGLLCLFDAAGPCGNAVKDAQRTKTNPTTQRTLTLIWGTTALPARAAAAEAWYRRLLDEVGAQTEGVNC